MQDGVESFLKEIFLDCSYRLFIILRVGEYISSEGHIREQNWVNPHI